MESHSAAEVRHSTAASTSRWAARLVPATVLIMLLCVVGWSAWPLVRPARSIYVVQAVLAPQPEADVPATPDSTGLVPNTPTVQAAGWLEAEPYFIACTALADGVVESIQVLEGDYVEAGQTVAQLVDDDSKLRLRTAEAVLARSEAVLGIARAEQQAAQRAWDDPVALERALGTSRASLAESRAELAQLPSLIASARATLVRLTEEADRVKRSTAAGAATEFELVVADQRAAAQKAEVSALEARQPILEARIDRLLAEVDAAERDLDLRIEDRRRLDAATAGVTEAESEVARALAGRDEAALELSRMTIVAPASGFVQRRLKVPGDKAIRMMDSPHSSHIVHLYDPEHLQVRVDVPLADASHVRLGQPCEVVVEVLPDRVFEGEVVIITHEADLQKNTLQVKVRVLDPDPILRPEMLTRVKFVGNQPKAATPSNNVEQVNAHRVRVPASSVDSDSRVWLVTDRHNGRGLLSPRPVNVLGSDGDWLIVSGDVSPGSLLAADPNASSENERVRVVAMAGNGRPS